MTAGQEVLTTEHDFYSTHEALRLLAEGDGTGVRRVALYDEPATASVDQIVTRLSEALAPAHPRGRAHLGALRDRPEAACQRVVRRNRLPGKLIEYRTAAADRRRRVRIRGRGQLTRPISAATY